MARNTTISMAANVWTEITNANATSITFQALKNPSGVFVSGTTGGAPTSTAGAILYEPQQGERNAALVDLFPGVSAVRVWAISDQAARVMVSHA